jgi:hypothetical protein
MSSEIVQTFGWRSSTPASAFSSSAEKTAPLGFDGEFSISHLVRGVIARSSSSACSLKPFCALVGTQTGTPSA